jgi:hypothetical protein
LYGTFGHVEVLEGEPAGEHEIVGAGNAGPVELARLSARALRQLLHRVDMKLGWNRDDNDGVGDARDRRQVARLIRQAVVLIGVRYEGARRPVEQHVIVVGADECVDGDQGVAAGAVVDDHRLAPALTQAIRQEPSADVGVAADAKRHNELHRPRRPLGFGGGGGRKRNESK